MIFFPLPFCLFNISLSPTRTADLTLLVGTAITPPKSSRASADRHWSRLPDPDPDPDPDVLILNRFRLPVSASQISPLFPFYAARLTSWLLSFHPALSWILIPNRNPNQSKPIFKPAAYLFNNPHPSLF